MKSLLQLGKRILFWGYGRTSWQYDVLCALILAFIFLTPPWWFATGKRTAGASHQSTSKAATLLLPWPDGFPANPDTGEVERRARQLTGRSDLRVREIRKVSGGGGQTVAFEVDIE